MSKRAWMPLYVGDYLGDTGHLSTAQHGAYLLLMMHYWRQGSLPDEDKQLAAITKLPLRLWLDNRETLQAFFYDGWRHKRIDEELVKMETKTARRAAAGQKGGLRSAMNRMMLEDAAGRSKGQAMLQQHSTTNTHIRNITTTVSEDTGDGFAKGLSVSPELLAKLRG